MEVQSERYLKNNLIQLEPDSKNFVVQASKPYCANCKVLIMEIIGHVEYVFAKHSVLHVAI